MNTKIYIPQDRLTFGKCKGETLQDIYQFNPKYIEWLIKYTDDFLIDLEDFRLLPIPTPYFVEKRYKNMLWFQPQANPVKEAILVLKNGELIPEKKFSFSNESIRILKQKVDGMYKAPPYSPISDAKDGDFM